jgi:hypothetical protein
MAQGEPSWIEQAPGNGQVLRHGGSTLRQDRAKHESMRIKNVKRGQENLPASPDSMCRRTSFTERTTTATR